MNDILKSGLPALAAAALLWPLNLIGAEKKTAPPTSAYHQQVRQLLPVAWWSFDQKRTDLGDIEGSVRFGQPGPTKKQFKSFTDANLAAGFGVGSDKKGAVIRVEDPGPGSQFDFDNGDPITIEAWVKPDEDIRNGSTMYVLGKGRTNNRGQEPNNHNYGLRLFRSGDAVLLSFLFRSRAQGGLAPLGFLRGFRPRIRLASHRGNLRLRQAG
jgi:hypothetical protein